MPAIESSCDIPIKVKNKVSLILYLRLKDYTLHKRPTNNSDECGKITVISLDGTLFEYVRLTGRIIPGKVQVGENRTMDEENWDFLNKELIYQDVLLHETEFIQEKIFQEFEQNAATKAEATLLDQSVFKHRDILDEVWAYYWMWDYIKWI